MQATVKSIRLIVQSKSKWKPLKLISSSSISSQQMNLMSVTSSTNASEYCTTTLTGSTMANMEDSQFCQPLDRFRRDHIDNLRRKLQTIDSKTPQEQDITLEKDEETKLARICVRSGAKNALSGRMISKLTEVIDELYEWREGKGVLLYGFNGTFCSGSDLVSVRATANSETGLEIAQIMQYNLMRLQHLPMISVAFVEGFALGGGAELATGADLRLMSSSARIGFVHIKMGVCCGWGGGSRLVQLLGPSRALDLLSSGRLVDADEAKQIGLSNGTIATGSPSIGQTNTNTNNTNTITNTDITSTPRQRPLDEAMEFLRTHTNGAKETYAALKTMLNSARTLPLADSLKVEAQLFASTWGKEPHIRALNGNLKHNNSSSTSTSSSTSSSCSASSSKSSSFSNSKP